MRKFIIAASVAVTLGATPVAAMAQSQDEAAYKLELTERFIAAMQMDQIGDMVAGMSTMFLPSDDLTEDEAAGLQLMMQDIAGPMTERLFRARVPVYAETFSVEELEALVVFYESDIGRSMTRKSYEAAPRIAQAIQAVMPEIMGDMANAMCDRQGCDDEERALLIAQLSAAYPEPAAE
jgi:hypothetical protein